MPKTISAMHGAAGWVVWLASLGLLTPLGCGGRTVSTRLRNAGPDVEWIWQAPTQWGTSMMQAGFAFGMINAGALTEQGQVVVLTNYGGSWAWLERCNAFLLDVETGKVLRRVRGPYQTMGAWYLDGQVAYVEGTVDERRVWHALDLGSGRKAEGVSGPKGGRHGQWVGGPYYGGPRLFDEPESADPEPERFAIGLGRTLIVTGRTLELEVADASGQPERHRLCRTPRLGTPHVLTNDRRRLLFGTGSYVICVDMRDVQSPAPRTQPSPETGPM